MDSNIALKLIKTKQLHVAKCLSVAEPQLPSSSCYKHYNEAAKSNMTNVHGDSKSCPMMNSCLSPVCCYQCVDKCKVSFNIFNNFMLKKYNSNKKLFWIIIYVTGALLNIDYRKKNCFSVPIEFNNFITGCWSGNGWSYQIRSAFNP